MKIALAIGPGSISLHGPIDFDRLYTGRALTGSETSFVNIATGLSRLGHDVTLYCPTKKERQDGDFKIFDLETGFRDVRGLDACIVLNEPDLFRMLPSGAGGFRVLCQQYNDFNYAQKDFDNFVDAYAFLSPVHLDHFVRHTPPDQKITREKMVWIPNSLIPWPLEGEPKKRNPHTAVWCSSPDRGLHRLLEAWPEVRKKVPDAELKIFYLLDPWLDRQWEPQNKLGVRARFVKECLSILGRNGENGITVVGPVSPTRMAEELSTAGVLPYPCDCVTFTEGFSVAIMDACRAGAVPIISDADAIGDIYKGVAHVIKGKPGNNKEQWVEAITRAMLNEPWAVSVAKRCEDFALNFELKNTALLWESFLKDNRGRSTGELNKKSLPATIAEFVGPSPLTKTKEPNSVVTMLSTSPKFRIAIILGSVSRLVHGYFNIDDVFERGRSLTGTGSNFFNLCWGLAERGHTIDAFTDLVSNSIGTEKFAGVNFYNRESADIGLDYDCYISVNEPDLLKDAPVDKLRICQMQLNDFSYCKAGFDEYVDYYISPSDMHARHLADVQSIDRTKVISIPLSINAEFFEEPVTRKPNSIIYCSSPDRGLHHLMHIFPLVRRQVPDASLRIFYTIKPWLDLMATVPEHPYTSAQKRRAETITKTFEEFGEQGQNGLWLHGPVPTKTMALELKASQVMAYPCDPVSFTEGFSVSIMDACAAGCVPIVAPADALPDVYTGVVRFIRGKPENRYDQWADEIVRAMQDSDFADGIRHPARAFAMQHTRQKIAKLWEVLIRERRKP
jgi:glycosyltransferase involved in cell wall biosynthesis